MYMTLRRNICIWSISIIRGILTPFWATWLHIYSSIGWWWCMSVTEWTLANFTGLILVMTMRTTRRRMVMWAVCLCAIHCSWGWVSSSVGRQLHHQAGHHCHHPHWGSYQWRSELEKVFLPPGTVFWGRIFLILRRNFPNIEEKFSEWTFLIFLMNFLNFPNLLNEFS